MQVLPLQKGLKLYLNTRSVLKQGWLCSHTRLVNRCRGEVRMFLFKQRFEIPF